MLFLEKRKNLIPALSAIFFDFKNCDVYFAASSNEWVLYKIFLKSSNDRFFTFHEFLFQNNLLFQVLHL